MFCRSRWLSASVTTQLPRHLQLPLIGSHHTVCRISEYNEKNLHREQHKWSANNVKSGINANCHKRLGFQTKIMVAKVSRSFLRSLSVLNSVKHWHCIEMSLSPCPPQYNAKNN